MTRKGGWTRAGSRGRFRYLDARGTRIADPAKIERIESLRIPPAWHDVRISPRPTAKLQATGVDSAGRRQYLYHPDFRAQQEREKFQKLTRFAAQLPELRAAMTEHFELETFELERICALAVRLINLAWFRVGSDEYARRYKTFGITTLRKRHVTVLRRRITFSYPGKGGARVRAVLVDPDLALAMRELKELPGGRRLFRYQLDAQLSNLTGRHLNEYIASFMGEELRAKDFRTWGGTLLAAVALAERGPAETDAEAKRTLAGVMRMVGAKLGNTAAVARESYVSPAVIDQYLLGRTLEDFRPRHLRVVGARDAALDPEEQALLSLLRSWRLQQARQEAEKAA